VPEQLEPFSIMLPLGSLDNAFFLQSALIVCVAIARWKHINISWLTVVGSLTCP